MGDAREPFGSPQSPAENHAKKHSNNVQEEIDSELELMRPSHANKRLAPPPPSANHPEKTEAASSKSLPLPHRRCFIHPAFRPGWCLSLCWCRASFGILPDDSLSVSLSLCLSIDRVPDPDYFKGFKWFISQDSFTLSSVFEWSLWNHVWKLHFSSIPLLFLGGFPSGGLLRIPWLFVIWHPSLCCIASSLHLVSSHFLCFLLDLLLPPPPSLSLSILLLLLLLLFARCFFLFLRLFGCVVVLVGVSPSIVTASTLRDNKIDIHVSVTINTSTPNVSPVLPAVPTSLSVSGVACTLADLKKHRSQSRVLVTTPSQLPVAPCSVNSLQSAFLFPAVGTLNEPGNGVSSSPASPPKPVHAHHESIVQSTSKFHFHLVSLLFCFGSRFLRWERSGGLKRSPPQKKRKIKNSTVVRTPADSLQRTPRGRGSFKDLLFENP